MDHVIELTRKRGHNCAGCDSLEGGPSPRASPVQGQEEHGSRMASMVFSAPSIRPSQGQHPVAEALMSGQ